MAEPAGCPSPREPAPKPTAGPGSPVTPKAVGASTPWRHVTLGQLIEAGLVRVPFELEHRYRGAPLTARIEAADRVVFAGQPYDSLSTAGGIARRSIIGSKPGREYPQTNGWTFWEYRRADGTLGALDELRRELYERKG